MGAFRDGEEPFRSSLLARRLLEGAGEQVVGRLLGQETVVLDDFKDYAMPLVELQRLLDWYPMGRGQGRSVPMMAKRYVLTSNTSPDDWYLRADPHRTRPPPNLRLRRALRPPDRVPGRVGSFLPPGPGPGLG